jgi:hypothetical protein
MLIDFTQKILDIHGNEIPATGGQDSKAMTLADAAVNALLIPYNDEPNLAGVEKVKRFKLAQKIEDGADRVELTAEEISAIKLLIGKAFNATVVGYSYELLENPKTKEALN